MEAPIHRTVSWRPAVAGVAEVFHAHWHDHAYPGHTRDMWTLLVVDHGVIGYNLDRHDRAPAAAPPLVPRVARLARELLDADPVGTAGIASVATSLSVSTPHLARSFVTAYGIAPHQYVVGRRLDLARRLLRDGLPAAVIATESGFYDQAHLNRHFRRLLGTTPGRYQRSSRT
ncbi:MAG TPA: AraC family transcriptional regulator [Humibacillus sp.]|nr:AraC family transcriptional regulator [Humibacillus sp.]